MGVVVKRPRTPAQRNAQRICNRAFRKSPRGKYWHQRHRALARGIPWEITFDEWWGVWQASGHWADRGKMPWQYCMGRKGDKGPYRVDNVEIVTVRENAQASWFANLQPDPEADVLDVEAL